MVTKPGSDTATLKSKLLLLQEQINSFLEVYTELSNATLLSDEFVFSLNSLREQYAELCATAASIKNLLQYFGQSEIVDSELERSYYDGDRTQALVKIVTRIKLIPKFKMGNIEEVIRDFKNSFENDIDYLLN